MSSAPPPDVDLRELLVALREVMARADLFTSHRVEKESLSLRERMSQVMERLSGGGFVDFTDLFDFTEGRPGVVVTFLAMLELIKSSILELVQSEPFAPIHVRLRESATGRDPMSAPSLKQIVEGALIAAGGPLTLDQLLALFGEDDERPERASVLVAVRALREDYQTRGIEIVEVAGGYRVQVRASVAPWVARLWDEKAAALLPRPAGDALADRLSSADHARRDRGDPRGRRQHQYRQDADRARMGPGGRASRRARSAGALCDDAQVSGLFWSTLAQ